MNRVTTTQSINDEISFQHALFLREIQAWVWGRYPTRQLSASDVFHVLKWASSGLPGRAFTRAFDDYLTREPHCFDDGMRLSKLEFVAKRVIGEDKRRKFDHQVVQPLPIVLPDIDDPYRKGIDKIVECGKRAIHPPIRDILRDAYLKLVHAREMAKNEHPDWQKSPENALKYRAQYLCDYGECLDAIFDNAAQMLTPDERATIQKLDSKEAVHAFRLGDDAKARFLARIIRQKLAVYFGLEKLLV